ncbi:MAG: hypothetical protein H0U67_09710 [Gemmatimonadetes bacterium]|jgi:hypothetical protein|nr:hypothetical protein [Gemmatimonadota bacterium]
MIRLHYRPTALFHFKRLDATNKGALTLPMPTPYAVRAAFLAVSDDPAATFPAVKEKRIVVRPPASIVVNPCWVKILDLKRGEAAERRKWDNPEATAEYQRTMSLREYAFIPGDGSADLHIYFDSLDGIEDLPPRVNYFGKRGSFVQYTGHDEADPPLEPEEGLVFELEDFSENASWDRVNVYSGNRPPRERFTQRAQPALTVRGVKHTLYRF